MCIFQDIINATHTHARTNAHTHTCMHTQNTHTQTKDRHTHTSQQRKPTKGTHYPWFTAKIQKLVRKGIATTSKERKLDLSWKPQQRSWKEKYRKNSVARAGATWGTRLLQQTEEKSKPCLKRFCMYISWTPTLSCGWHPSTKGQWSTSNWPKAESRRLDKPLLVKGSAVNAPCLMPGVNTHLWWRSQLQHKAQQSSWSTWAPVKLLDQLAFPPRKEVSK